MIGRPALTLAYRVAETLRKSEGDMPAILRNDLLKALSEPKPLSIATLRTLASSLHQQRLRVAQPEQVDVFVERHAGRFLEHAHRVFRMDVGSRRDVDAIDLVAKIPGDEIAHPPTLREDCWSNGLATLSLAASFRNQPVGLEPHALDPEQQFVDRVLRLGRVAGAPILVPALEIVVVRRVGGRGHQRGARHQAAAARRSADAAGRNAPAADARRHR